MIPFFEYNAIIIGPIVIQVWGLLVATGMITGLAFATLLAKKYFLAKEVIWDMVVWAIVGGLIGGRLAHVLFYEPAYYLQAPLEMLKIWHGGMSSTGGFIGAFLGLYLYARRRKFKFTELLPYLDVLSISLWLGWGVGRIGCFFIHDHPGKLTNFFLAVSFSSGARHDLGLYEVILGLVIFGIYFSLFKIFAKKRWGLSTASSFLTYAVVRFFLDFLRAEDVPGSDVRYFFLTPSQWGMLVVALGLTFWLAKDRMLKPKVKNGEVA